VPNTETRDLTIMLSLRTTQRCLAANRSVYTAAVGCVCID